MTKNTQLTKEKNRKLQKKMSPKLKTTVKILHIVNRVRKQAIEWEKILANHTS
jgi:hypothetical protein